MFENCKECKIFARVNRLGLCETCNHVDEQLMSLSREILNEEGKMTVFDLSERIGIGAKRIFRWIEEGRIKSSYFKHECPLCGKDMLSGECVCHKSTYVQSLDERIKHPEKFYSTTRGEKRIQKYWDEESKIQRKQKRSIWMRT